MAAKDFAALQEIIGRLAPETAEKMRVMFGHVERMPDTDDESAMRNFFVVAATMIDRFTLVGGDFNESQRAMMAAMTLRELERDEVRKSQRH